MSRADARTQMSEAIAEAAQRWRDPAYPPRAEAVDRTLSCANRFTLEAVSFAVNQQMRQLTVTALEEWVGGRRAGERRTIGVLSAGNVPFVELQDFLAVLLTGHAYRGALSSKSPYLLPSFAADVAAGRAGFDVSFVDADGLFRESEAIIATGSDATREWAQERCAEAEIPPGNRLLRGSGFGVAVLDGTETDDELEGLAEDALLHEGLGCRNVAIIWAPPDLSPDPLLTAFANFRAVFPTHPDSPGSLAMPKAFLEAVGAPHAYGEGLEFLLSNGEPEVQQPGHVRWVEYAHRDAPLAWIAEHAESIQLVVGKEYIMQDLPPELAVCKFGEAQRPPLDWKPDGQDVIDFLSRLV